MCSNCWIPLVRSTCELLVHQQKTKKSKRDQTATKRAFTRHREVCTENVRDSAHSPLRSCPCLTSLVTVSSEFSVVSAEFQTQHCAAFHVRFKCMSLCHQVSFVRIRVYVGKRRLLLLHDDLHDHVLQHHMFHQPQTSFGCPCLR